MAETTVRTVKVKVNGQCLSTSEVLTVNGTVNMIVCEIETDNWWTAFPAIIAIFKNDNDGREYIADVINGRCTVPHEVLRKAGNILMAIKGENETQIERSETKVIAVQKRTLQDGANSIDPSPNQYAEYIERAGEAIQEYFDEHKSEFKGDPGEPGEPGPPGDPGEPGPPGPEYDDTEIRSEIASIQQELNDKMEFYKVVLEGSPVKFWHEGVVQNYADLEAKYRDDKYFLYAEYESVTFIPSLPPDEDPVHPENVIEFSATWLYEGIQHITSIKINELEQIKIEEFECASSDDLNDVKKDLSDLDSSKADKSELDGKVGFTDFASGSKAGVVRIERSFGTNSDSRGFLYGQAFTMEQYPSLNDVGFISKKTLENVLAERLKEPQFELIEEITLSEATTRIDRNAEPNGTPYNFKEVAILIKTPKDRPSYGAFIWASGSQITRFAPNGNPTYDQYSACNINVVGGRIFCNGTLTSINNMTNTSGYTAIPNGVFGMVGDSITSLNFITYSSSIPSGTVITIYGARA